jgi:hypothetical protein
MPRYDPPIVMVDTLNGIATQTKLMREKRKLGKDMELLGSAQFDHRMSHGNIDISTIDCDVCDALVKANEETQTKHIEIGRRLEKLKTRLWAGL